MTCFTQMKQITNEYVPELTWENEFKQKRKKSMNVPIKLLCFLPECVQCEAVNLMASVCPGCTLAAHHVLQICAESLQIILCCHREPWDSQQHTGKSSQSHFTRLKARELLLLLLKGQRWSTSSLCACVGFLLTSHTSAQSQPGDV